VQREDLKLYVFLEGLLIVGCLIFEQVPLFGVVRLSSGSDISISVPSSAAHPTSKTVSESPASETKSHGEERSSSDSTFLLGVRYIWVHKRSRRKGIAGLLCDVARKTAVFGTLFEKSATSFSQPTSSGIDFAKAYTKTDSIWAYS
jgi:ESCO1/2 acetyl-transferase